MTIFCVAHSDMDWDGGTVVVDTNAGDDTYTTFGIRCEVSPVDGGIYPTAPEWTGQTDIWAHGYFDRWTPSGTTLRDWLAFSKGGKGGRHVGCLRSVQGDNGQMFVDDGAGNRLLGTAFVFPTGAGYYDFHVVINDLEVLTEIYLNGALVQQDIFNVGSTYTMTHFTYSAATTTTFWGVRVSQFIVADESTIGWRMFERRPTGDGELTGWDGSYTDIDEDTLSNTDAITAAGTADATFTRAALTLPGGYDVKAIALSGMYRSGDPTITEITNIFRHDSTTYEGEAVSADNGYANHIVIYDKDPATDAAWEASLVEGTSLQFGVRIVSA